MLHSPWACRCAAAAGLLARSLVAKAQSLPPDFDAYVQRTMATFQVPGMAIAVVKDGKVLLAKGYGTSKLGSSTPVTGDTLFGIASNTKLFTSTALSILVDEGKLNWNDPVQKFLPAFALSDPYVSHEMTVRDLLVHRSGLGLGGGDLLWWPRSTYTADEIVARLRYVPLATSFRSNYAYDNVLYLVAGQLIERVSGLPWHRFVQERILDKVGMAHSVTSYVEALKGGDVSGTHSVVDGKLQEVKPETGTVTGPAGGIMSNANDMSKWLLVQLAKGKLTDGSRLFSEERANDMWSLTTPIRAIGPTGEEPFRSIAPNFNGYCLGIATSDYRGHRMLNHTGGLPGYLSWLSMFPNEHFGLVVLTNQESGAAFESIAYRLQDYLLGAKAIDWTQAFDDLHLKPAPDGGGKKVARNAQSHPSLPLESYCGTYRDKWYGDITIAMEGKRAVMRFGHTPALVGELEHWQYDTFVVRWRDRSLKADAFITFSLKGDGTIQSAKMAPFDEEVDFSYDYQDLLLVPVKS